MPNDMFESTAIPRTRGGDPFHASVSALAEELFPAHAGVIPIKEKLRLTRNTIPRTRGGDPNEQHIRRIDKYYSPHTRG